MIAIAHMRPEVPCTRVVQLVVPDRHGGVVRAQDLRRHIAQGLAVAEGVIVESRWDDGWMYRVDLTAGDDCREHRHEDGQLWVCDFEVTAREA